MEKTMKRKFISLISVLVITVLSACGPAPVPTLSVADLQGTAVADAWVAMTLTQAAIPTATETPVPPTPTITLTPFPTATLLLVPTFALVPAATLPDTSVADPCNAPPPLEPKGKKVKIKFVNKSDGGVTFSFGMTQENEEKECGTYSFSLGRYEEPVVEVLAGCYWGYGWVDGKVPSTTQTNNNLCMTDTSKITTIWINAEVINFH